MAAVVAVALRLIARIFNRWIDRFERA